MAGAEVLPVDLLAAIYHRCASSYDRARFAAVCASWRAVALRQPKPQALPLLLPSTVNGRRDRTTRAYSPEEGRVLRAPLPGFPRCRQIVGSHAGGWVAAATGSRVVVVNLFTRGRALLSADFACRCRDAEREASDKIFIKKIIFSKDPVSKDCILAAITTGCKIGVCRRRSKDAGADRAWTTRGCGGWVDRACPSLVDIAFCNGELYGLSCGKLLYRLVVGQNTSGAPVVSSFDKLTTKPIPLGDAKYIFELHGKLGMAVEFTRQCKAKFFLVFGLATRRNKTGSFTYKWIRMTSLGDHALFLGPGCCKAVHVSAVDKHGLVEANHIYYSSSGGYENPLAREDLGSCVVDCWKSDGVQYSERGYHCYLKDVSSGNYSCTWILPPQL